MVRLTRKNNIETQEPCTLREKPNQDRNFYKLRHLHHIYMETQGDFTIKFDKAGLKAIKNISTSVGKLETRLNKLNSTITKLNQTQVMYGKAIQNLLKQQLKVQQKMAGGIGVMASNAKLQTGLIKQLMAAGKKGAGGAGAQKQQTRMEKILEQLRKYLEQFWNKLPSQLQSILKKMHKGLMDGLKNVWSKLSNSQKQVLQRAAGKMASMAVNTLKGAQRIVSRGISVANKGNKLGQKIGAGISKIWSKTGGKLASVSDKMPGMAKGLLGATALASIGGLIAKVIQASPLLKAMMQIMNTAFTLILRPIGDFFGAFFRPLFIYFLKEVAIPFFKAGKGWMKEGEKWGKVALGFFIDPVMAIYSGAMKAISQGWGALKGLFGFEATPAWVDPATGLAAAGGPLEEVELFQSDPAAWLRQKHGIEDKTTGTGGQPKPEETIWDKMWGGIGGIGGGLLGLLAGIFGQIDWDGIWATLTGGFDQVYQALQNGYDWLVNGLDGVSRGLQLGGEWLSRSFSSIATGLSSSLTNLSNWLSRAGLQLQQSVLALSQNLLAALLGVFDGFRTIGDQLGQALGSVSAGIQGAGTIIWDGLSSVGETIWNGITGLGQTITTGLGGLGTEFKIGEIDIGGALGNLGKMLEDAGINIMAAVNIATGGLLGDLDTSSKRPTRTFSGNDAVQTGPGTYTLGGQTHYGNAADLAGKTVTVSQPATYDKANLRTLGDPTGQKFEGPTGAMMDIYKTVGGEKVKIDPTSPEGIRIQQGYQRQLENQAANEAQTAQFTKVKNMDSEQAKAYVLAGGGEKGIKAAEYTKQHGLNLSTYEGLAALGATGVDHSMITQAESVVGQRNMMAAASQAMSANTSSAAGYGGGSISASVGQSLGHGGSWGMTGGGTTTSIGGGMNSVSGSSPSGNTGVGGGAGAARSSRGGSSGGGSSSGSSSGGSSSGGGGAGGGSGASGSRGSRGGSKSGASGKGGSSGGSGSKGGAGRSRSSRGKGKQFGGIIDEPILGIGLHSGDEWAFGESGNELVTPMSDLEGGKPINVLNIHIGNITKEADYLKLKPLIQRWMLEASSRRGSV